MGIALFSEAVLLPGNSALHTEPETIAEALNLSLNFWFVLPTLIPSIAPVVDPSLEALFNVLIAWALCFFGFAIDERENEYPGGMLPYLTGALFLTNVFFLPMLALRSPKAQPSGDTTTLQRLGESRLAAFAFGIVVPLLAVYWFGFGRADAFEPGFEARVGESHAARRHRPARLLLCGRPLCLCPLPRRPRAERRGATRRRRECAWRARRAVCALLRLGRVAADEAAGVGRVMF